MSNLDKSYEKLAEMLKNNTTEPVKVNDITIGEIERLCILAVRNHVQIDVTVRPDEVEIGIEPWESTISEHNSKITPRVKIDSVKLP